MHFNHLRLFKKGILGTLGSIFLLGSDINIAINNKPKELSPLIDRVVNTTPNIIISYPADPASDYTGWEKYFSELLVLALSKVETPFSLQSIPIKTRSTTRAERLLHDDIVTINWIHTSIRREKTLLPIRIPLFKGLIGWRIFLIHHSKARLLKNIKTLDNLKKLNALQGIDWPDTKVLNGNGFKLQTTRHTENLLRMLQFGRGDYFPRSIVEIWGELDSFKNMGLLVEEHLAVQYPTAYYFFVSKKNPEVKKLIEKGLNIAISDGSFNQLFMKYFGDAIERSNLINRKIFTIKNSQLSNETPLSRAELWYSPHKK